MTARKKVEEKKILNLHRKFCGETGITLLCMTTIEDAVWLRYLKLTSLSIRDSDHTSSYPRHLCYMQHQDVLMPQQTVANVCCISIVAPAETHLWREAIQ